jgi:hypothetical protein
MHRTTPKRLLTVCAAALAAATCAFPTDNSPKVLVLIEAPHTFLLRGEEMSVHARAVRIVGTDTMDVPNVDFAWASGSGTLATVSQDCCGYATITGVNSGIVDIIASAVNYNQATAGDLSLRVANPLEIDSVRPDSVRWGEVMTVYGVGVDGIFLSSLSGANLIPYPFSASHDSVTGLGQISYWVPPPAHSDNLFFLGAGVFGLATETTFVKPEDVYEPNDTQASFIDLDAGGPWPGTLLAPVLFLNPALAFEAQDRFGEGSDWFKFQRSDTTQATTFIISYPSFGDTLTRTFMIDSLGWSGTYVFRPSVSFNGTKWSYCHNQRFAPLQVFHDSTILALKTMPSQRMTILNFFSTPLRYAMTVVDGYVTTDPRIGPDKYEENDMCTYADVPAQHINLASVQFNDTLTIDNPFDIDWYRIDIGPTVNPGDSVRIKTSPRPFVALQDSSDIDVYVLTAPGASSITSSQAAGSTEYVAFAPVANASYYVVVVDYAGVPTRYSMCMRRSAPLTTCGPLAPAPPAPAPRPKLRLAPRGTFSVAPAAPSAPWVVGSPFAPRPRP